MLSFRVADMFNPGEVAPWRTFQTITHGGVVEQPDSPRSIRETRSTQSAYASTAVFNVPVNSTKNRLLFQPDDIFRQLWTEEEWIHDMLAALPVADVRIDLHRGRIAWPTT